MSKKQQQTGQTKGSRWRRGWLLAVIVLGGGFFYIQSQLAPPVATGQAVPVEIPQGYGAGEVSQLLEEEGLIRNSTLFSFYLALNGQNDQLKAGKYSFTQGMSLNQIASVLVGGEKKSNTLTFTIPEGFTLEQIADLLAKNRILDKEAFLKEADSGVFESDLLAGLPQDAGLKHRLEGYLFPDTYEVFQGATPHEVIDSMLKQTSAVLKPEWREQMKKRGLNIHQTLTIASLIEREAQAPKERPLISGVISNRLKADPPMKLQIDATVQYALGKQKETLLFKDLEIDSPYNTYKIQGLPPGPIAASGKSAIEAALFPELHDFYFYVTKNDGTGEHFFANSFAEHEQNIARSQK